MKRIGKNLIWFALAILLSGNVWSDAGNHAWGDDSPCPESEYVMPAVEQSTDDQADADRLAELLALDPPPFWQRPTYVLEQPDVIAITLEGDVSNDKLKAIVNKEHRIGPDGFVSFDGFGSVRVDGLTPSEAEEMLHVHLARQLDDNNFDVSVRVQSCDSKEYKIVFVSHQLGSQEMRFPFTDENTTLLGALCRISDEDEEHANDEPLLPPGSGDKVLVLRSGSDSFKTVEMLTLDINDAILEARDFEDGKLDGNRKADIYVKSGDTIMILPDSQDELMRPDAEVAVEPTLAPQFDDDDLFSMSPVADNDAEWLAVHSGHGKPEREKPSDLVGDLEKEQEKIHWASNGIKPSQLAKLRLRKPDYAAGDLKTADQFDAKPHPSVSPYGSKAPRQIARCVFLDGERFPLEGVGPLTSLMEYTDKKPNFVLTYVLQSKPAGTWIILFGEEDAVTELNTVFKEIAENQEK